jgi:hypothetical protein
MKIMPIVTVNGSDASTGVSLNAGASLSALEKTLQA